MRANISFPVIIPLCVISVSGANIAVATASRATWKQC